MKPSTTSAFALGFFTAFVLPENPGEDPRTWFLFESSRRGDATGR
jgi:hypothetical protein